MASRNRKSMESVFSAVYETNKWKGTESSSGPGSGVFVAAVLNRVLPQLCRAYRVETLLDAPCGDFNWMKEMDLPIRHYIGVDVVAAVIDKNNLRYGNDQRRFQLADITQDDLPESDLVLCRDGLVHLVADDALAALRRFRDSSRLVLTTTFYAVEKNIPGSTGGWRPINLQLEPFSLPPPIAIIPERAFDPAHPHSDKSLGLWDLSTLEL
jgi:hypothetical protein